MKKARRLFRGGEKEKILPCRECGTLVYRFRISIHGPLCQVCQRLSDYARKLGVKKY